MGWWSEWQEMVSMMLLPWRRQKLASRWVAPELMYPKRQLTWSWWMMTSPQFCKAWVSVLIWNDLWFCLRSPHPLYFSCIELADLFGMFCVCTYHNQPKWPDLLDFSGVRLKRENPSSITLGISSGFSWARKLYSSYIVLSFALPEVNVSGLFYSMIQTASASVGREQQMRDGK